MTVGTMTISTVHAQVVLPVSELKYDAPVLPPTLWATTAMVTRHLALLPGQTLLDKSVEQQHRPYNINAELNYQKTAGDFGQLNLGNSNVSAIHFDGDVYAGYVEFSAQRDDLQLGAVGAYESFDLAGFAQQRVGVMPYAKWLLPIGSETSFNFVGTLYYYDNDVTSHLAPRTFAAYRTLGASVSAALQFDTRYTYKAVTVMQDSPGWYSYMGSLALTLQMQSDDAERQVVYQQDVVDEVRDQRLLILAGNIGARLYERTAMMLVGELGKDMSHYDGTLSSAADHYTRLSWKITRTLSPRWSVQAGIGKTFSHDVDVTEMRLSTSANF